MYIGTRIEYIHTLLWFKHTNFGHTYCIDWTLVYFLTK